MHNMIVLVMTMLHERSSVTLHLFASQ